MAVSQAFEGQVDLAFLYKGENAMKIETPKITFVMIEYKFENERILPVIYVTCNLDSNMHTKITASYESSKFKLTLKKKNALSKTSKAFSTVVSGTFNYITSNTNVNDTDKLNKKVESADTSYRSITIGLVSVEMTNKLRTSFNGIYKNTTQLDLIQKLALEGLNNVIFEPLKDNKKYENIMIPPLSTRYKLLEFLFNDSAFYNTNFEFFMDFKNTYLISKNGEAISPNGPGLVVIDVQDATSVDSFDDGFKIQDGTYHICVSGSDINMIINEGTEKVSNQIVSFNDNNLNASTIGVSMNNSEESSTKKQFVRSDNGNILKNELETNSAMLDIVKQNLDSDIFTPNRSYYVSQYGNYNKYDGTYILAYKREFYKLSEDADKFTVTCNVGLKRVANISTSMGSKIPVKSTLTTPALKTTTAGSKSATSTVKASTTK